MFKQWLRSHRMWFENDGAPSGAPAPEPEPTPETDDKTPKTIAEALAVIAKQQEALKEANKEAADRRKKLKAFEENEVKRQEEEKKRREAEMSEVEKAKARAAELEAQLADRDKRMAETLIRTAVETAATKLKFHQPADAYALVDLKTITIEDGQVKGVEDALKAIVKAKPYLVDSGDGKGTPRPDGKRSTIVTKENLKVGVRL